MSEQQYRHWRVETDEEQILWLFLDREGASVNSLSREVFAEFDVIISGILNRNPRAVILTSGKKKGFIAGADISQFTKLKDTEEAFSLIRQAQLVLDKFEALPMPTVALISGFCLGGGLEVALSCRYRIAEDIPSTKLGLPEVMLGIHPGWGGTVRLPRLVGAPEAMKIMLPGRSVSARKAQRIGLVDAAVAERELKRAARYYALNAPELKQPRACVGSLKCAWNKLSNTGVMRNLLGAMFEKQLAKKVSKEHYPAPFAIIDNWVKEGVCHGAYLAEAKSIANLMMTDTSRNLVRVFFLQTQLKGQARGENFKPAHVHVIGAGTMGGDIAAWCAFKGFRVTLQDQSPDRIAPAVARAYKLYKKKLRKPRLIQEVMDRLQPDVDGYGLAKADLVIEAIFEDLKVKQDLYQSIEPKLKEGALLATNTSSIPLDELNTVLKDPGRLVGMHFFNPVAKMQLVEVVKSEKTSADVFAKAKSFVGKISRLPLPTKSVPGFLVNRALMPYLLEAMTLIEEGVKPDDIDYAAEKFGMPMGPITLADKVGLDVCLHVAKILSESYGAKVPERLEKMVADGYLGCKTGRGFYQYEKGRPRRRDANPSAASVAVWTDRMVLMLLNETVACWHEKVVDDIDLLDAGMIFGTGFAPFRGGPLHYAKQQGVNNIVNKLNNLAQQFGERFQPHAGWQELLQCNSIDVEVQLEVKKTPEKVAETVSQSGEAQL